jgi:gliding motility-associated-like protein
MSAWAHEKCESSASSIAFIENKGQWEQHILFEASIPSGKLFLEKDRLTYLFYKQEDIAEIHDIHHGFSSKDMQTHIIHCHAYQVIFENCNQNPIIKREDTQSDYVNYYIGNDPEKWASKVGKHKKITYQNIYNGVDFVLYSKGAALKYDFVVHPNANPNDISLLYKGIENLNLRNGYLEISTSVNFVRDNPPVSFQKNKQIDTEYQLQQNRLKFKIASYNSTEELIIDPMLVFSTYSGSFSDNWGYTATFDNQGHLFSGGVAFGANYPTTLGAFQTTFAGGSASNFSTTGLDMVITKFSPSGTSLVYSTYLGGSSNEVPHSLIVNNDNELFVFGTTSSSNYPTTIGCYDNSFNGGTNFTASGIVYPNGSDIVITRFLEDGSAVVGSTYVGGSLNDGINSGLLYYNYADDFRGEIIISQNGNPIIATTTRSLDFPVSANAVQTTNAGKQDGCVFMLDPNLSTLVWSTYIGGTEEDAAYGVQMNSLGEVYIAGGTKSGDMPTTAGVLNPVFGGVTDGFLAKIINDGAAIEYCTYIGTDKHDQVYMVQLDTLDNVFVTGQTVGAIPVQPADVYHNENSGQFIQKLSPDLSSIIFSTVFGTGGGTVDISLTAFLVNECNQIYVSGWGGLVNRSNNGPSSSTTFGLPITSDAFQPNTDGSDFYLIVLSEDAKELQYATFFGGGLSAEHVDGGTSRFDKNGIVYQAVCGGCGGRSDFPTSEGAYSQTNNSSNCNIASFKFDLSLLSASANIVTPIICAPGTATFQNNSNGGLNFLWDFGDGGISTDFAPTHIYQDTGTFTVTLVIFDPASCIISDTSKVKVTVSKIPDITVTPVVGVCPGGTVQLEAFGAESYLWSPQTGLNDVFISNPIATIDNEITYIVTGASYCGTTKDTLIIPLFEDFTSADNDTTICVGESVLIRAYGGDQYQWSPTSGLNAHSGQQVFASPQQTTTYNIDITDQNNCLWEQSITVYVDTVLPKAFVSKDTLICFGDTAYLKAWGGIYFNWYANTWVDNYLSSTIQTAPLQTTKYTVEVGNACGIESTNVTVNVRTFYPQINHDVYACANDSVQINASGGVVYLWTPVNIFNNAGIANPKAIVDGPTEIVVKIVDSYTCEAVRTLYLDTFPKAYVNLGEDILINFNQVQRLEPEGNGVDFIWSPSLWLDCDTCQYPYIYPEKSQAYHVTVTNEYGCVASDSIMVFVRGVLHVPNTFTPGGDNTINDVFYAYGVDIVKFKMVIYNRWGELLFESEDMNRGWDGTHKGMICPIGTYVWLIEYTEISGQSGRMVGHVNIVR